MRPKPKLWPTGSSLLALCIGIHALLGALPLEAAEIRAGMAVADVTPPAGTRLWGYPERRQTSTDSDEKLNARILYLDGDRSGFAWVDLDYGRTFGRDSMDWVREQVNAAVPHVIFSATHTHSGPEILETYPEGRPGWEENALQNIVAAILKARNSAEPVRLGFAYGKYELGYNRRRVAADGAVTMLDDPKSEGTLADGPSDPTVAVLRIDRRDGTPLAILVNAAAHPVLRSKRDFRFSADFPGVVRRAVEGAWTPSPLCFFLQGAAGDIYPRWPSEASSADQAVQFAGEKLASEVLRISNSIQTRSAATGRIEVREDPVLLRGRWNEEQVQDVASYVGHVTRLFQAPVTAIAIDQTIAVVAVPGEFFVEHQMDLRKRSPLRDTIFAGYANGYYGYFPTIDAAAAGGSGASDAMAPSETGAGENIVNRALLLLNNALGRLKPEPAPTRTTYPSTGPARKVP
jgi:neutral ceramidase